MKESKFSGKLMPFAWVNLVYLASIILTANILMPFGLCYRERWMAKNTVINGKQLVFEGKAFPLFLKQRIFAIIGPILISAAIIILFAGDDIGSYNILPEWLAISSSTLLLVGYVLYTVWLMRKMKKWVIKHTKFE